jgi:uncharacterized protein (TIGR02145 family)
MTIGQCEITEWGSQTTSSTSVSDDNYTNDAHMVDLGLSVYWADCNVGATKAEDYGGLYGWADATGLKTSTNLIDYPSSKPPSNISGNVNYDIARAKWGGNWRLPTSTEFNELYNNTTHTWTTLNGVSGCRFTSTKTGYTDKSIFLPAAGRRSGTSYITQGSYGYYWTGTYYGINNYAYMYTFYNGNNIYLSDDYRYMGESVRPVSDK